MAQEMEVVERKRGKVVEPKLLIDEKLREVLYKSWLQGDSIDLSETTPQELLEKVALQRIDHPVLGLVSPLEVIILNYLTMAMGGNVAAMDKVYNELQHKGVSKVQVTHETLSPAARQILEVTGMIDTEGNIIIRSEKPQPVQDTAFTMIDG